MPGSPFCERGHSHDLHLLLGGFWRQSRLTDAGEEAAPAPAKRWLKSQAREARLQPGVLFPGQGSRLLLETAQESLPHGPSSFALRVPVLTSPATGALFFPIKTC